MPIYVQNSDSRWSRNAVDDAHHLCIFDGEDQAVCTTHGTPIESCLKQPKGGLIFGDLLDQGEYVLTIVREKPYVGRLRLRRCTEVVLEELVDLAYDAAYGPDPHDILSWQDAALMAASEDTSVKRYRS
jgi:hypothetical protein